jgi:hypothetical protein
MSQSTFSRKSELFKTAQKGVIAALLSLRYRFAIVPLSHPLSLPLSSLRQEALQAFILSGAVS